MKSTLKLTLVCIITLKVFWKHICAHKPWHIHRCRVNKHASVSPPLWKWTQVHKDTNAHTKTPTHTHTCSLSETLSQESIQMGGDPITCLPTTGYLIRGQYLSPLGSKLKARQTLLLARTKLAFINCTLDVTLMNYWAKNLPWVVQNCEHWAYFVNANLLHVPWECT